MSHVPPAEPTPPQPDAQPTQAYPGDAQPTQAYPGDAQPTQAYPGDAQPTQAYPHPEAGYGQAYAQPAPPAAPYSGQTPPAYSGQTPPPAASAQPDYGQPAYGQPAVGQPAYGQPAVGQPAYGQPVYGQPGYPQPTGVDTRPKTVAWTALILAGAGTVLSLVGFFPAPWVGLIAVIIGGLALLGGFIFAIVGLAGRRNGGKPLSITALVLSIVGAVIGMFALIVALVLTGLSVADSSGTAIADDFAIGGDVSASDQASYLAEVRPQVTSAMLALDPTLTPEIIDVAFPDEALIAIGQMTLIAGEDGFNAFVNQAITGAGDAADAAAMHALYDAVHDAAEKYLH